MSNRLADERSPYLRQHAENPVDWYPWGDEAFAAARRDDKPIFLSIGVLHLPLVPVMAHESFEDPDIAAVLNRHFVSIKVDREERPDVDRVYMMFVQATTGMGGWPMSVWLTPDLKPFFGGTCFPPTSRWGRPGFTEVLEQLGGAWKTERRQLEESAEEVLARLREATGAGGAAPDRAPVAGLDTLATGIASFAQTYDERRGGFGGAPKFPRPSELLFLFEAHAVTGDWQARTMALDTLRAMSLGGMRDQVGGGFHRYSVDAEWRVPHFEKMLYDQAQLVLACLTAEQISGDEYYGTVAEDTLDYVRRDLCAPDGAFYSAEDADSPVAAPADQTHGQPGHETREGAFYVWTEGELRRLLGDDFGVAARRFGVEPGGNALADPQGEFTGQNILYVAQSIDDIAARAGLAPDDVVAALARTRQVLFEARAGRPRPHLDDKVLTAWNGLMIAAFARAARVLVDSPRRAEWRDAAVAAAESIQARLWKADERRLYRCAREGDAAVEGFCEDYAYLTWGLLELFQATGAGRWLTWARDLVQAETERFYDARDGGWFSTTGKDPSVLLRIKEDYDGAEPAAASVTVRNLLTLAHLTGDAALRDRAGRTLERYGPHLGRAVRVMPLMVANVAAWHGAGVQVVLAGDPASEDLRAMERVLVRHYLPSLVTFTMAPDGDAVSVLPWLGGMTAREGRATAHVCADFTCQMPVHDAEALAAQLDGIVRSARIAR